MHARPRGIADAHARLLIRATLESDPQPAKTQQTSMRARQALFPRIKRALPLRPHSTVTLLARFLGLSTSVPRTNAA